MAQRVFKTKGKLAGLMGAVLLLLPTTSVSAAPLPGPDCGQGASVVGNDTAGRVRLGTNVGTCTLQFAATFTKEPVCMAMNETNNGGPPSPVGAISTTTYLLIDAASSRGGALGDGDVVSYICVSY